MKIGVFGDIHSNLAALEVVLAALKTAGCARLFCTGDVVGYGPSPRECLRRVRDSGAVCVLGNHDDYVTDLFEENVKKLDPDTRTLVEWTRNQLAADELKWLATLPRAFVIEGATLFHGALGSHPWNYIATTQALQDHFAHQKTALAFCGHTHLPIYGCLRPGQPPVLEFFVKTRTVPHDAKVLVNPGAVGQPRDRDSRAAYCIWDTGSGEIHPFRIPYAVAETQTRIRASGLPERFAARLEFGK